jgi:hypothetical protein
VETVVTSRTLFEKDLVLVFLFENDRIARYFQFAEATKNLDFSIRVLNVDRAKKVLNLRSHPILKDSMRATTSNLLLWTALL